MEVHACAGTHTHIQTHPNTEVHKESKERSAKMAQRERRFEKSSKLQILNELEPRRFV